MTARLKLGAQAIAVAAVAGLLALLVWKLVHGSGTSVASQLRHGDHPSAPGFLLPRLDERGKLSLASLRGNVVVLNFWASWCVPCKAEAPLLEAAWRHYRSDHVVVVGIDSQDFSGDARSFVRRHDLTYPVVHDGAGNLLGRYGVTGFPETFFITRNGKAVGHVPGQLVAGQVEQGIRRALRS